MIEIKKTLFVVFICLMGHIVALAQKYQVRPLDLEQGLSLFVLNSFWKKSNR